MGRKRWVRLGQSPDHSARFGRDDKGEVGGTRKAAFETGHSLTLPLPSALSSRPERTRISYFAALNNGHVCGSP